MVPEQERAYKPTLEHDLQVLATTKLVEALVRSENSMRLRLDMLSEVVFELDGEQCLSFLNGAWTGLSRRNLTQSLGRQMVDFLHPEDRPAVQRLLSQPETPTQSSVTCRLLCAEDGERWVEIAAVPTLTQGWIGTMRDVTSVKQATDRLALLSLVADHTDNFVLITDAVGSIRWANQAFCRFTEYSLEEVRGRRPGELLQGPDTDPREIERIRAELRLNRSFRSEVLNYTRSGRPYWVTLHVTPIFDAEHRLHSYISVQSDSTQLRELNEQLLREKLRAESASQAKSRFLSSISHELRTPLNAFTGLLDVLRSTPIDERQRDYLDKMSTASRMLMQLINDVLDFSKIDADMMRLDPQPFALIDLWEDVSDMLKAEASGKGLSVRRRYEPGAARSVIGDETRLRQILLNLTSNAVKFTASGCIELALLVVQEHADASTLEFSVRDTGIGIAAEQLDSVFDAFSQAEASTSRRFGGSGLGLAISRRLAHLMGGTLTAQSAPGHGSTFRLRLTLAHGAAMAPRRTRALPRQRPANALRGVRVLLAEDNPINQVVAREILHLQGASVQIAEDGLQAVQAVEQAGPDFHLVLMDLQMPHLDGHAAARRIRELRPDLPVLAMSANTGEQDRAESLAAGMRAHISKPFETQQLIIAMLDALGAPHGLDDAGEEPSRPAVPAGASSAHDQHMHRLAADPQLLDVSSALERLGGDLALYRQLVARLERQLSELLSKLDDSSPQQAQSWTAVHAVKGAAATLGVRELATQLALCEETLRGRSPTPWARALDALHAATSRALPVIRELLEGTADGEPACAAEPAHAAATDALLQRLRGLLQSNDMKALEVFGELASIPEPHRPHWWPRVEQALQCLDFESALQELPLHEA